MTIVSEQYDNYILAYDADEEPIRPFKLSLHATKDEIDLAKRILAAEREYEITNNQICH